MDTNVSSSAKEAEVVKPLAQPTSIHEHPGAHWPVIAAAITLPIICGLIIASFLLLPKIGGDVDNDGEAGTTATTRQNPTHVARALKKVEIANAAERGAVCNDGSPGAYYFRPGTQAHAKDWIVYLHGGGACTSEADCAARADETPNLTSTLNHPETIVEDGILSASATKNPDFYNWNQVEVIYCSSDGWSGTTEGVIEGETWYFHGRDIVTALFEDLQNEEIIRTATLAQAGRLLFAGSSAGGGGVSKNLDYVASLLPEVEVRGFIDSSYSIDIEPYVVLTGFNDQTSEGVAAYQNRLADDTCSQAHLSDPGYCTILDHVYPYISTPLYIFNNQLDPKRLSNLGITNAQDPAQADWIRNTYVPAFTEAISDVDPIFAPYQHFHTMLISDRFFTTKIDGVSAAEAFANWYFGRGGQTRYVETAP